METTHGATLMRCSSILCSETSWVKSIQLLVAGVTEKSGARLCLHSVRTGHQPTRKLWAETCANHHLTISAHKTHCRSVPREPRNYNGECAYANVFTFLVEGIDVVILRTPIRNSFMSVWFPDRLWRPAIEWVQGTFCPREHGPGRESDLSLLSTSDFNEYLQL